MIGVRFLKRLLGKTEQPDGAAFTPATRALLEIDKWAATELVIKLRDIIDHHPYPLDELLLMSAAFAFLLRPRPALLPRGAGGGAGGATGSSSSSRG